MVTLSHPFLSQTAADLMSRDVVAIPQAMSLKAAARLLSQAHISGAPVVDAEGRCVGVLSASDFVRWAENGERAARRGGPEPGPVFSAWQVVDTDVLPEDEVHQYMTADPVTASPAARIDELARMMLDAHIHRLIVVDERGRPVGVISSTDVLAAVARAGHEC
jgi:CBS-domain-containing membrane protein